MYIYIRARASVFTTEEDMEKDIEAKLVREIKRMKGIAYKFISPGNRGVPDRIVILPGGRIFFVELKTEVGRLSALQRVQRRILQKLGCEVRALHGAEDVEAFLEEVQDAI